LKPHLTHRSVRAIRFAPSSDFASLRCCTTTTSREPFSAGSAISGSELFMIHVLPRAFTSRAPFSPAHQLLTATFCPSFASNVPPSTPPPPPRAALPALRLPFSTRAAECTDSRTAQRERGSYAAPSKPNNWNRSRPKQMRVDATDFRAVFGKHYCMH